MSEYSATISWQRGEHEPFVDQRYSRAHWWEFDGGVRVPASSSPHVVPLPWSVAEHVDPEEAFVASLSSCHMLTFLAICAKKRLVVDAYSDRAVGRMEKNVEGKLAVTTVDLHPKVTFGAGVSVDAATLKKLHHDAHENCFIASSVKTLVIVHHA